MAGPLRPAGVLLRLFLALLLSAVSGVLVAGLAVPVVAGLGLAAKTASAEFLALPAQLQIPVSATRSTFLAADGSVLATFYRANRVEVPLAAVPAQTRQAVLAIEDSRFYDHDGVDVKGTLRAAVTNATSGEVAQGGSTLTQQYVKNVLLEAATDEAGQDAAVEQSLDRKLREARYALALERTLSKDEILQRYLNIAYFGDGVYGIGTAANHFFAKPVEQLTLAESALLAGVVQSPSDHDLASTDPAVRASAQDRRDTVLSRMRDLGWITEQEHADVTSTPVPVLTPAEVDSGCQAQGVNAPFFCDWVKHELEDTPVGAALGPTKQARQDAVFRGGVTVRTTLDPRVQAAAQSAVDEQVPNGDPSGLAAVADVVEPGTGAVRAMAVDRAFGEDPARGQTQVNLAAGGTFGYQPGSSFKPFFLASALQQGIALDTTLFAPDRYAPTAFPYVDEDGVPQEVGNAGDSQAGTYDLVSGTRASVNTFYVQLAERTGLEAPLALAERLGVRQLDQGAEGPLPRLGSAVLGTAGVSPLAMAGAYATFAARGMHCTPFTVLAVTGPGGPLPVPPPACAQALEVPVADTVNAVLAGVVDGDDPRRTGAGASLGGRPVAGKTGTTNGSRAAWFVGYTPQLATAVWVGRTTPEDLVGITLKGRSYPQVYGGTIPASIFRQAMTGALQGVPPVPFS